MLHILISNKMSFAFIGAITAAVVNLSLAIIFLSKHRNNLIRKTFGFISGCLFIWNFFSIFAVYFKIKFHQGIQVASTINLFHRLNSIGLVFLPTAVLHFVMSFTEIKNKKILSVSYLLSLVFLLTLLFPYATSTKWTYVFCCFQIPIYLYSICLLFYKYNKIDSFTEKNRIRYLIIGAIIGIAGGLTDTFPAFGINFPVFGSFSNALYALIIASTIIQYRLFGIGEIAKGTLSFILMAILISGILILFKFVSLGSMIYLFAFIFASIIILIYQPLKNEINSWLGSHNDYQQKIKEFNNVIPSITSTKGLLELLLNTANGIPRVSRFSLAVKNKKDFHILNSSKEISSDNVLIEKLIKENSFIVKEELTARVRFSNDVPDNKNTLENIIKTMDVLEAEVIIPLQLKRELLGLLIAGRKTSGDIFTNKELEFLSGLCSITALALETYKSHIESERSKRLAALGTMVSSVAHEIKNPLGSIKGAAQYLESESGKNEFLDIITTETNRLNELVTEFLDFARPITVKTESYNITGLIDKTLSLVKKDNIKFKKEYSDVPLLSLDPDLMKQVFLNLFLNSVQAMPEGGEITVSAEKQNNNSVEIKIKDTGTGISAEDKEKIWEPFFTTKKKGAGLGLPIVRQIIEAHNGMIDIGNAEKNGTIVTIWLPGDKNA